MLPIKVMGTEMVYADIIFFLSWLDSPQWARTSSLSRLHDHTRRHTIVGRPPLDE